MGRPKFLNDTHNHYFDPQQERSKTIAIGTRRWCGNAGKGGGRSRSAVAIRPIWKNEVYSDNQAMLAWRDIRMRFGSPRMHSSPAKQKRLELNRDVTKDPKKSESEKIEREC